MHLYPFRIQNLLLVIVRITFQFRTRKYLLGTMLLLTDRILQFLDQRLRKEYLLSSIEWQKELGLALFGLYNFSARSL
jgi:hypothetical protein